jgi:protein-L-isoaspartate(D-aspartate) O-methyltransferase
MDFIDDLIRDSWLKTPKIIEAFQEIKRADFLEEDTKDLAELNEALPIGYGQTISQPLVVAFMLELLQPQSGEKILDVGFGSGWTSALLAKIVGEKGLPAGRQGKIIAIELIPELMEFGKKNIEKYSFIKKGIVECLCSDGSKGYEKEAPYDKILASATAEKLPESWKEQLKIGGRIVAPIGNSIWLFIKKNQDEFLEKEYPGFAFVPLITKN